MRPLFGLLLLQSVSLCYQTKGPDMRGSYGSLRKLGYLMIRILLFRVITILGSPNFRKLPYGSFRKLGTLI